GWRRITCGVPPVSCSSRSAYGCSSSAADGARDVIPLCGDAWRQPRGSGEVRSGGARCDTRRDEALDAVDGAEVLGRYFFVADGDLKALLEERHELEDPQRVHDTGIDAVLGVGALAAAGG